MTFGPRNHNSPVPSASSSAPVSGSTSFSSPPATHQPTEPSHCNALASRLRWVGITPLGRPVVPLE